MEELNPKGVRNLSAGLLLQCFREARLKPRRRINKSKREAYRVPDSEREKKFINSNSFIQLCDEIGLNAERIKKKFNKSFSIVNI